MWFLKKKAATRSRGQKTVNVFAPAKVNLALHVTGQRRDGYHLIDSLVTFAPVGDRIAIESSDELTLKVDGPETAGVPSDAGNLVLRVAELLDPKGKAAITLSKSLPVASGIGGGSADAAAALRGLLVHWRLSGLADMSDDALRPYADRLLELGADIPMCLISSPARIRGIGEQIESLSDLPPVPALLVNPRIEISTLAVFKALRDKENSSMPETLPNFPDLRSFANWLGRQRNDLQPAAIGMEPMIGNVLDRLAEADGALLSRMSGSGATCFGIFPDKASAVVAGELIRRDHPDWWVAAGVLGDQQHRAMPEVN